VEEIGEPLPAGVSEAHACPDNRIPILPIRRDGSEGRWQVSPATLRGYHAQGRVKIGGNSERGFTVYYLKPGEWAKVESGEYEANGIGPDGSLILSGNETSNETVLAVPSTQWTVPSHDSTQYGSRLLLNVIPQRRFPFPKSLYAVEDVLRFFVHNKDAAIILDFFAGSGTTAHAVTRLNKQDGGRRQCISVTNNEVGSDEAGRLRNDNLRPGDLEWEKWGICDYITKPRIKAVITGKTPEGEPIRGDYKFTDEFPMADGFEENAEFFTLTYETPVAVSHNRAFARIAPLLWMRAGSKGRRIEALPDTGWEVADTYGLLTELDAAGVFSEAVAKVGKLRVAYIVTDDERRFQAIVRQLPETVEPVRLYESYLTNFRFAMGR
jgi:adenine-specific DNA-methyltransferase